MIKLYISVVIFEYAVDFFFVFMQRFQMDITLLSIWPILLLYVMMFRCYDLLNFVIHINCLYIISLIRLLSTTQTEVNPNSISFVHVRQMDAPSPASFTSMTVSLDPFRGLWTVMDSSLRPNYGPVFPIEVSDYIITCTLSAFQEITD